MTRIKICGIRRREDAEIVNALLPDYAGMVIEAPSSKRSVSREKARELSRLFDERILRVGVFLNAGNDVVLPLLREHVIDIAQLHGNESESEILEIETAGFPVIKAFPFSALEEAASSPAEYVLIDGRSPGSGKCFDWQLLSSFPRPFFLAGGIGPDNASEAIERLHPFALDSASGTERDGFKDFMLAKRVLEASGRIYG